MRGNVRVYVVINLVLFKKTTQVIEIYAHYHGESGIILFERSIFFKYKIVQILKFFWTNQLNYISFI